MPNVERYSLIIQRTIYTLSQKELGKIFEILSWRRKEKFSRTDREKNEEMQRLHAERSVFHTTRGRKASWRVQNLRGNCLIEKKRTACSIYDSTNA
jgi:hypothetical protein